MLLFRRKENSKCKNMSFRRWFLSQIDFHLRPFERYERERYFEQKHRDFKIQIYMLIQLFFRLCVLIFHFLMEFYIVLTRCVAFIGTVFVIVYFAYFYYALIRGVDEMCAFGATCNDTTLYCDLSKALLMHYNTNCSRQIFMEHKVFLYELLISKL